MKSRAETLKSWIIDLLFFVVGSVLLAISVQYFLAPNNIPSGGITGLSMMINFLAGGRFQVGTLVILLNIPLFVSSWFVLGRQFFIKTLLGTGLSAILMNVLEWLKIPVYHGDMVIAAIFGGIIGGAGIGLVFMRGGSTGGTDIASRLIKIKVPYMEIGKIMLIVEAVILVLAVIVYRNINNALYSIVTIYTYSVTIDAILYGIDTGKTLIIISNISAQIADRIMAEAQRGVTILKGRGAYTKEDKEVLLIAVRRQEMFKIREIVKEEDPKAFIIVCDTSETIGLGFKSILDNK